MLREPMLRERVPKLKHLVEPDRVHRLCYTDQDIFDLEIKNIFEKTWQYCGHDTQIPKAGDFFTFQIGRQPMVMVRAEDGKIHVLYNRCAHRGVQVCGSRKGHAEGALTCPYHSWRFHFDGTLESVPLEKGYRDTNFKKNDPAFSMTPAASVDIYRGFVFAKLDPSGPSLEEWMGPAKIAIDDMCDRSPVGRVEVVQPYNRVIQRSNWKFFMENQLDALHASVTHQSAGHAAAEVEREIKQRTGSAPAHLKPLSAVLMAFGGWDALQTANFPHGHSLLQGYLAPRPQDPDSLAYEALMEKAVGRARKEEVLSRSIHHVLLYPGVSIQPAMQQLRVLRPVAPGRTESEIWHFRLVGAPEAIYRRSLSYYNLVNSPSTMVNADDLENWQRGQLGLEGSGNDWVSFHRGMGRDRIDDGVLLSGEGTSEAPMRHQFATWLEFLEARK